MANRGMVHARWFGKDVEFEYSHQWITYAIVILRIAMGWVFLQAGLQKLFADGGWAAAVYLNNAIAEGNPFAGFFASLAGSGLIDALNVWGQVLIGLCLILGLFTRSAAFWGAVMMIFY